MKKAIVSLMISSLLFANLAYSSDYDFSKCITPGPNKTFIYTEECHLKVGQLVQDSQVKDGQIADYKKAIELKDLAITKSDERAALWMDTSAKLEDRLNKIDELRSKNEWLYFALGGLTVLGAGFMASKLLHP